VVEEETEEEEVDLNHIEVVERDREETDQRVKSVKVSDN
jgi:hypothetical protein